MLIMMKKNRKWSKEIWWLTNCAIAGRSQRAAVTHSTTSRVQFTRESRDHARILEHCEWTELNEYCWTWNVGWWSREKVLANRKDFNTDRIQHKEANNCIPICTMRGVTKVLCIYSSERSKNFIFIIVIVWSYLRVCENTVTPFLIY